MQIKIHIAKYLKNGGKFKSMKIRIYDIKWETDGKTVEGLPEEVIVENIPDSRQKEADIGFINDEYINEISDEYGWLIKSYKAERIGEN